MAIGVGKLSRRSNLPSGKIKMGIVQMVRRLRDGEYYGIILVKMGLVALQMALLMRTTSAGNSMGIRVFCAKEGVV